jgi:hypothetical protein
MMVDYNTRRGIQETGRSVHGGLVVKVADCHVNARWELAGRPASRTRARISRPWPARILTSLSPIYPVVQSHRR